MSHEINLTTNAISKVKQIILQKQKSENKNVFLRLKIASGGCYGFSYIFDFDTQINDDDIFIKDSNNDTIFAISQKIIKFVSGATVDFIEDLSSSYFTVINNPNASGGCGCGNSFSVI